MAIDRTISPPICDIQSFNIIRPRETILANGIPFYQIISDNTELIKIEFMFFAGNWFQSSPITAFGVNHMLVEGTSGMTSAQIAGLIEYYGAYLGYNLDKDNAYISVYTMSKYLAEVLPILEDIIKNANFPEHEVDQFRKKHKQQFLVEQTKVKNIARAVHARMMFGNSHPYGYMLVEEDFDTLNRPELISFHRTYYRSSNCKIIASGDTNEDDILLIEKYFGKEVWNDSHPENPVSIPIIPERDQKVYIEKKDAVQSAVRIGKVMLNKTHPDFVALSVVNCMLGGYFGSRLMKTIREDKGYTYGINSMLVTYLHAGYFSIASELGTKVTIPAIQDIYAEIERLRSSDITEEELQRVKNYMLGEIVRMFDGPFAQAENLISLLEYGFGYEYFDQYIATIRSVSTSQVHELAEKYLDPSTFFEVIVGKT